MLSRKELAIFRVKCDEDLLFFTRFFFKELRGGKFNVGDHHRELCNEFDQVKSYSTKLLNINIPPRHSKTELALNFIARGIGQNPSSNWLYITASDELRSEVSIRIRDIITHPYFKIMYGIELKKDQRSKNLWRTVEGGGLKTATIFGQVTGFGAGQMTNDESTEVDEVENEDLTNFITGEGDYERPFEGCQVWDDINKMNDSQADNANNQKVADVIFNTLLSRENSDDTPIIHIQQRAGVTDATAHLMKHYGLENDKCKFIVMPIIRDGKPLWPGKLSLESIELIRTSSKTSHVFDTQYMQKPVRREGILFPIEELNRYDHTKFNTDNREIDAKHAFVDVADKGTDFLCAPFGFIINKRIYIHDVVFTTDEVKLTNPEVAQRINDYKPPYVHCESNGGGALYVDLLQESHVINDFTSLIGETATGNKMTRMIAMSAFIKKYCYFREDYNPNSHYGRFMENLTEFAKDGSSIHDDGPDGLTGLCIFIKRFYSELYEGEAVEEDGYSNR